MGWDILRVRKLRMVTIHGINGMYDHEDGVGGARLQEGNLLALSEGVGYTLGIFSFLSVGYKICLRKSLVQSQCFLFLKYTHIIDLRIQNAC